MKFIKCDFFKNNKGKRICLITGIVGLLFLVYGIILATADYSLSILLNNENYKFLVGETLYYNTDLKIDGELNGYKVYINDKNQKGSSYSLGEGTYKVTFKKHFTKASFNVEVKYEPDLYVTDLNNKVIHNYLSNTKPFKIVVNNTKKVVKVDNVVYNNESYTEVGNYLVSIDDGKEYNINILDEF